MLSPTLLVEGVWLLERTKKLPSVVWVGSSSTFFRVAVVARQRGSLPRSWLVTRQPAELVTAFVTAPFLVQKALKTANSEKFVFSCQTVSGMPEPLVSLCSGFRFRPGKQANSIPPSLSPLVTVLSPLSLKSAQKRPSSQVPEDFVLRKFESIMQRVDSLMGKVGSLMPGRRWEGWCRERHNH